MQRKNSILNKKSRDAIAMIMAIGVIVILATIMALSLKLSTQTVKQTTDLYLYEQAELLSKSASEFALLKISENNITANPCGVTNLTFKENGIYDINISMKYIYTSPSPCAAAQTYTTVTTPEQNGSVLMDVSVSVNDSTVSSEPITYFRRSIQKL